MTWTRMEGQLWLQLGINEYGKVTRKSVQFESGVPGRLNEGSVDLVKVFCCTCWRGHLHFGIHICAAWLAQVYLILNFANVLQRSYAPSSLGVKAPHQRGGSPQQPGLIHPQKNRVFWHPLLEADIFLSFFCVFFVLAVFLDSAAHGQCCPQTVFSNKDMLLHVMK